MDTLTLAKNQYRAQQWTGYIQERKASGMTINAWCEQKGLNPRSYYYWLRKLRQEVSQEHQQQIVPVTLTPSLCPKGKTVTLQASGIRIYLEEGACLVTAQALVAALLNPC